jgi:hypothetical protein
MKTRRKKRGGNFFTPEQKRVVSIRNRGENHSRKMAEQLHDLVQQIERQYNGEAYHRFIEEKIAKWKEATPRSLARLRIIHDIARYRLKRQQMIRDILTLRNEEAKNISNYMKVAANRKLSNKSGSVLSNQMRQKKINESIAEIEERIQLWKDELPERPISLFEFNDDTYYKIVVIDPIYDKPIDDSIRITILPEQYHMIDEWVFGCQDLLHHMKKEHDPEPHKISTVSSNVSELYLLLYFVLKNYANSLKNHADSIKKNVRGGTFRPEDYIQCGKVSVHAAKVYLEWKQYQLSHHFFRVSASTVEQAQERLERIKKYGCSVPF